MSEAVANELLGRPSDARLLILNNDDLGMYGAVNRAIVETITDGVASSCSLMVPTPRAPEAMELLRSEPSIPFGIHLTLICDYDDYVWGPLTRRERVPSLLNEAGRFYNSVETDRLVAQARLDEVEVEYRAQIEAVFDAGLEPTHLDWHCFRDGGREDIFDLTVALAKEHGLAVRVSDPSARDKMRAEGLPVNDHDLLDSFEFDPDDKAARFAQMLRDLPTGLSQWAVHSSVGDDEARAVDPDGWRIRASDYAFLLSNEARDIVRDEGIDVIDYRPLQEAWRRGK
jgi:chitin disaccharide deacetylase